MSVATKNPFALLEDETSRPSSPVAAPAAAPTPAPAARGQQKPRGGPAARGGKYYARGGGAKPAGREETDDAPQDKKSDVRGRGGRGGSRGGPRGRGRQFDRHSQTGKVDSDKKISQGWGAEEGKAELKAEEAAISDANADAATPAGGEWGSSAAGADDWASPAAPSDAPANSNDKPERDGRPPRREREPEEEDNTLTLDQYLAQQKEKESIVVPKLEGLRRANDGNTFKDLVAIDKTDSESYFVGKTKTAPKARVKKDEKVFIEIEGRFDRPSRGGRGRGGDVRGRGSPRGGRGGPRPAGRGTAASFDVEDQTAFPSLS